MSTEIDAIDALLPQTQCRRCGFDGCRPYAQALAAGETDLNRCPPGGAATIESLAQLLRRPALPLDPECGSSPDAVAWIDPQRCIGCARCLPACPVDAIVGAQRYLHTIISQQCTGCELCLAPCPVDCIVMRPSTADLPSPGENRRRYDAHRERLEQRAHNRASLLAERKRDAQTAD